MGAPIPRRIFTVEEYHLMAQAGVLSEDERVELVEGEVVLMTPVGSRHAACVRRLNRLFSTRTGAKAVVGVQDPVRLGAYSEPQPDVALLKPRADFYASAHRIARIAQTVSGWCARSMNIETLAELEARGEEIARRGRFPGRGKGLPGGPGAGGAMVPAEPRPALAEILGVTTSGGSGKGLG